MGVMIEPALKGAGQPARRRGMASEGRVAATGPASGGVWGELLPGGAMEATLGCVASAGPSQCKHSVDVRGRGGGRRSVLGSLGTDINSSNNVSHGEC